jgi:hypothetical protein
MSKINKRNKKAYPKICFFNPPIAVLRACPVLSGINSSLPFGGEIH